MNRKRTKIVATLGPASDDADVLAELFRLGVDVVRINFSHGSASEQQARVKLVRQVSKALELQVGILADLQGPKIRIAKFAQGKVALNAGDEFVLDVSLAEEAGDAHAVGVDYKELVDDVEAGDILLLDDGRIVLQVSSVAGSRITCQVKTGGELSNNKGINRQGGGLSAAALTEKDLADIKELRVVDADYVALSFVRDANDVRRARELVKLAGSDAGIIAKIERTEAVTNLDEIIEASDGVMVARGDLAVEIGEAEVPGVQKKIIKRARDLNRPVITATQMMESMIHSQVPTRAEVSDVANAVLDGTDAVMLSAETAVGDYPQQVVAAMARACCGAEKHPITMRSSHRMQLEFQRVDEAIAMATMYAANHIHIKAILALTESGATALMMSRIRSGIPIFSMSRHVNTCRKASLYRGVYPIHFDVTSVPAGEVDQRGIAQLQAMDLVETGDLVVITEGDYMGILGGTNCLRIVKVGSVA